LKISDIDWETVTKEINNNGYALVPRLSTNMITPIYRQTVSGQILMNFKGFAMKINRQTKYIFIKLVLVNLINN